jgi:hypothetical protein
MCNSLTIGLFIIVLEIDEGVVTLEAEALVKEGDFDLVAVITAFG